MHPAAIGPYKIERELGRGGMGEVFLAHDSRLERAVAIKALPPHLASDPNRLARFQREAKVLASLSHPGIAAIYGLEEAAGHQYLILEFVDGETLAERLVNGPIPVEEALSYAKHIAEAVEVAHEKGVVHRDLKPANIMVTHDGVVKVLDFGLARTAEGSPSSTASPAAGELDSPTLPLRSPTIPGAIMGTAGYMSPEQARGKPVDKRSDIFSFGCVLYEMLTGTGPFPGETVTDSLGAILHREPNWAEIPAGTPARVRELLRNCLAKDRRNRLHDIGDARLELERAIAGHEWAHASAAHPGGSSAWRWGLAAAGGLALLAAGWTAKWAFERPAPAAPAQSFHVSATLPAKPELNYIIGIAPDARFVVYKAFRQPEPDSLKPGSMLVVRRLDRNETKVIEGTEGVTDASLSADGRWIAFAATKTLAGSKLTLKKVGLDDGHPAGTPETLCDLPSGGGMGLCWSSDREIIAALQWEQKILAVSALGGEPRIVLSEEQSKEIDNWGEVRPLVAGKSVLATRWSLVGQTIKERTEVVDLASGKRTPLLANAAGTQLVDGGYVVARRNQNALIAARLDMKTLQIVGEPVTVWSGPLTGQFLVSANGTLAMTSGSGDISGRKLAWIDERGQPQPIAAAPRPYGNIAVSPDGDRVAMNLDPADQNELPTDLWTLDLSSRTFNRVPTQGPAWGFAWTKDNQRLAYNLVNQDGFAIWSRRADGSGDAVRMHSSPSQMLMFPTDWSPDGKVLAVLQVDLTKDAADVLMLEQGAGSAEWTARPYLNSPTVTEDSLRFSPDGKWVRFISSGSGQRELYIQRFTGAGSGATDAKGGRRQVSMGGATSGGWCSPDGKEIRYIDRDGQVMSVQVETEPSLSASAPKVLYSIKDLKTRDTAFAPDGRLMAVMQSPDEQPNRIDLIVNFLDELRAKLPPAK